MRTSLHRASRQHISLRVLRVLLLLLQLAVQPVSPSVLSRILITIDLQAARTAR